MPLDAAGRRHPYLFSTVTDPVTGLKFTPISGTANITKFKVEGPGVPADTTVESRYSNPRMLAQAYEMAGMNHGYETYY